MLTVFVIAIIVIVAILGYAASRPDRFQVRRSIAIKAAPAAIFPLINDFRSWTSWSPYEKLDPTMKRVFGGPAAGQGASYAWESGGKAGIGRMEIAESVPPSKIAINLDFTKPFEAHNVVTFTLEPQGETTTVAWVMDGTHVFIGKAMSIFVNMDRLIGKDFEAGLANLKSVAER